MLGATWGLVKHVFSRGFCGSDQIPLENQSWKRFCLHFTLWKVLLGAPGCPWAILGAPLGDLGTLQGCPGILLGLPRASPGTLQGLPGISKTSQGPSATCRSPQEMQKMSLSETYIKPSKTQTCTNPNVTKVPKTHQNNFE